MPSKHHTAIQVSSLISLSLALPACSGWPPVIWHAMHNLLMQAVYFSMTARRAYSDFVVDDFGLGVTLTGMILSALILLQRGGSGGLNSPVSSS